MEEFLKELGVYVKELWPIVTGFLIIGGQWYWNNKKTKNGLKTEELNNEIIESDRENKEIQNMKDILGILQSNIKEELLSKNETIDKLSLIIKELNVKIDQLSIDIKILNDRMDNDNTSIKDIASKCTGKRKVGEVCQVLLHLKNKETQNDNKTNI